MAKTFNIYCDESTHLKNDKHPYMVLGYISIAYSQMKLAKEQIKAIKTKHNYSGELKWTNIHDATYPLYNDIVKYFFMTDMKFRAIVVDKSQIDESKTDYSFDDFYFRMYYQLLHHQMDMDNNYNVYLDIKDTCSHHKLHKLQDILKWNSSIRHFQFIRSYESSFLQIADVLMGAINYNLRIEKGEIEGKVISKKKIINEIKGHTNISLNKTTPLSSNKFNLFFISLK